MFLSYKNDPTEAEEAGNNLVALIIEAVILIVLPLAFILA